MCWSKDYFFHLFLRNDDAKVIFYLFAGFLNSRPFFPLSLPPLHPPLSITLNHPLRRLVILHKPHRAILFQKSIRLHKRLPRLFEFHDDVSVRPEAVVHRGHFRIQFFAGCYVGGSLVYLQFREKVRDGFSAVRAYFRAVEGDDEVRHVWRRVVERDKVVLGGEEDVEDEEAGLGVGLAPLFAIGVPGLEGEEAGAGHHEVLDVGNVVGDGRVRVAKDGEDVRLDAEVHGDELGAAFFVAGGYAAKDATPRLAGFVPGGDGPVGDGADGGVGVVEVEDARRGLLEKLARAVAEELVHAHLHFE